MKPIVLNSKLLYAKGHSIVSFNILIYSNMHFTLENNSLSVLNNIILRGAYMTYQEFKKYSDYYENTKLLNIIRYLSIKECLYK